MANVMTVKWPGRRTGNTPAEAERALRSEAAIRMMPPAARRAAMDKAAAAKLALQQVACSRPWFDNCWTEGQPFPPPADTSPMVPCDCPRCRRQGRVWPAHYMVDVPNPAADGPVAYECHLESLDDWSAAHLPSSPSGLALRAIREGRIRLRRRRTHLGNAARR